MPQSIDEAPERLRQQVRSSYGEVARGENLLGQILRDEAGEWAQRFGYRASEIESAPDGANLGLGCGHPSALAQLQPGERVLDLGCGAGFDLSLAAAAVGPTGRAIGVDMTVDMISKARRALRRAGHEHAEARLSSMESLPLEDACVDVVISNCAINLSPEKDRVIAEICRVLRPGGRIAISDMVLHAAMPPEIASLLDTYVGCVGGAMLRDEYLELYQRHGFGDVRIASEINLGVALDATHPYVSEIANQSGLGLDPEEIQRLLCLVSSASLEATKGEDNA